MKFLSIRFVIADEVASNKCIVQFYESIASQLGVKIPDVKFDCRKILISANIQDKIYKAYELQYPDAFAKDPEGTELQTAMMMANSGPKVDNSFPDNTVEIFNGFFTWETKECDFQVVLQISLDEEEEISEKD